MSKDPTIESSQGVTTTRVVDQQLPKPDRNNRQRRHTSEIQAAVKELQEAAAKQRLQLEMHLDQDLGVIVVSVREGNQGRVLRQIPTDEALRLARMLKAGQLRLLDRLI